MKTESRSPFAAVKASPGISIAVLLLIACFAAIAVSYFIVQKDADNDQRIDLRHCPVMRPPVTRRHSLN